MAKQKRRLSMREILFAHLYLSAPSGTEAAREAGYTGDLRKRACQLLKKPEVVALIDAARARLVIKAEIKAERVIEELKKIAFLDPRRFFNHDNSLVDITEMDADSAACISAVIFRKGGIRLRFCDKLHAIDLLGRYLRLWLGKGEIDHDRLAEVLEAFRHGATDKDKDKDETIQ